MTQPPAHEALFDRLLFVIEGSLLDVKRSAGIIAPCGFALMPDGEIRTVYPAERLGYEDFNTLIAETVVELRAMREIEPGIEAVAIATELVDDDGGFAGFIVQLEVATGGAVVFFPCEPAGEAEGWVVGEPEGVEEPFAGSVFSGA